ncbi:MAG: DUF4278 domain-containing protein [Leptolyngbyaceae cyanobacterium MO_188.B28]|nr:DUF4278 domain-containing protein [Leptolyngbyaceae cyanobacterium MO_188.B28]
MQLTYRGVRYDYNPPRVDLNETKEGGKYRGVDIRFRTVKKNTVHQPTLDLVYRGAAYRTGESAPASASIPANAAAPAPTVSAAATQSATSMSEKARFMMINRHQSIKQRQQSMLTRLAKEVGLTADVTQYWNRIQGKVHPSFWATYNRSGATIS